MGGVRFGGARGQKWELLETSWIGMEWFSLAWFGLARLSHSTCRSRQELYDFPIMHNGHLNAAW